MFNRDLLYFPICDGDIVWRPLGRDPSATRISRDRNANATQTWQDYARSHRPRGETARGQQKGNRRKRLLPSRCPVIASRITASVALGRTARPGPTWGVRDAFGPCLRGVGVTREPRPVVSERVSSMVAKRYLHDTTDTDTQ